MKKIFLMFMLCVPLFAQVGRYELKHIPFRYWTGLDSEYDTITVIFDTMTGDMYEIYYSLWEVSWDYSDSTFVSQDREYIKERIIFKETSVESKTVTRARPRSSDIEGPTPSQIEAIEKLWRRYKANPVILNDEQVARVKELRKRWGLIKPKKP